MTMDITYYNKSEECGPVIASVGVHVAELKGMHINNIQILKSKSGGWYVGLPSFKNKDMEKWKKIISFEQEINQKFLDAIRIAIEKYAQEKGISVA